MNIRRAAAMLAWLLTAAGLTVLGQPPANADIAGLVWPADGVVTTTAAEHLSTEGARAIDIANSGSNVPVVAAAHGTVAVASVGGNKLCHSQDSSSNGLGNYVTIRHQSASGTTYTTYAHLSSESVSVGQAVSQGQQIGVMGSTGCSTGQHVHFAVSTCINIWGCDLWNAPDVADGTHITRGTPITNSNYPGTEAAAAVDSDGDGVPDSSDLCPAQPGLPQYAGCPDTDGDGIPDNYDQCPLRWAHLANGCQLAFAGSPLRLDVTGDGRADSVAFYRYDNGELALWAWPGTSTGLASPYQAWHTPSGWDGTRVIPAGTNDVNGDGRPDVLAYYRYDNGELALWAWPATATGLGNPYQACRP